MDAHQLKMALRNVDYPAAKQELIRAAEAAGAPEEMIRALRAIPPEVYRNREEVARSIPGDPAEELDVTPAQRAEQARERAATAGSTCPSTSARFPSPRWKRNWTADMTTTFDPHLSMVRPVTPRTPEGCEECLRLGSEWVHLRLCLTCGHVGCCDSSPLRHARAHAHTIGHPIVQSFEPGEDWRWCYVDETYV